MGALFYRLKTRPCAGLRWKAADPNLASPELFPKVGELLLYSLQHSGIWRKKSLRDLCGEGPPSILQRAQRRLVWQQENWISLHHKLAAVTEASIAAGSLQWKANCVLEKGESSIPDETLAFIEASAALWSGPSPQKAWRQLVLWQE